MIRIRAARIDERAALETLQKMASLSNEHDRSAIEAHPDAIDLPERQIADGHVFVAEDAEGVIGFAVVLPREDGDAELDGLFVAPDRQRKGAGRALLGHAARIAETRGAATLHVIGNPHAEGFYLANGFRTTSAATTRFGPALDMRRDLAPSLGAALRAAARRIIRSTSPRLDARVIARHVLGLDDAGLVAREDSPLAPTESLAFYAAIERRIAGEPVAYIVGEKEFWGLTIKCRPPMLLPRPDSETLISAAVKRRDRAAPLRILDLGTGTGCLLLAALSEFKAAHGVGVDYLGAAVVLSRENAAALGFAARAEIREGSWTEGLDGPFDLILANPPYVADAERDTLAVDIRDFEDPRALFAGADGLSAYRVIFADAPRLLSPQGLMIVELGAGQEEAVTVIASAAFPGANIAADPDLGGRPRALVVDCAQKTV